MDFAKFYEKAYEWTLNMGPRIIIAMIVLLVGLWLVKNLRRWLRKTMMKKIEESTLVSFIVSLSITSLHILLILLIMQILGIQMTLFTALIAAMGVAAGLALSGTLQNFASGVLILLLKPFRQGDNIVTQGQEGRVSSIQLFYTVVTTFDNKTVIVPNSKLSNEVIINTSREGKRRLDIELKFSYGMDIEKIRSVVENTINSLKTVLRDPPHRIGISALDPDGYKVMVNVWTPAHGFHDIRLLLQEKIMGNLKAAGIKLPGM